MKLSKEVVDLESKTKLNFYKEYLRINEEDPEFAKIIEYYENQIVQISFNDFGAISITNKAGDEEYLVKSSAVMKLFQRFALNLHRLMSVQAEIDEVERDCGL